MTTKDKVCLIIPPSPFLLDQRVFPSLGILFVARALQDLAQPVQVLDLSGLVNYLEVLRLYLSNHRPYVVGITTTTPQLPMTLQIAKVIRSTTPNTKIIVGGPHITLITAAANKGVARASEALRSLEKQVNVLVAGDNPSGITEALVSPGGLVDVDTLRKERQLPDGQWPARDLIDLKTYHYHIDGVPATSIITQLGCPFGCRFCGGRESPTFRQIKTRNVDDIAAELIMLRENYGYQGFMFYDDELNVKSSHLIDLMTTLRRLQDERKERWRFRGFVRADLFSEKQAQAMKEAGFEWLLIGFESGSRRILTNMDKGTDPGLNLQALEIAHNAGLKVKALMSLGHPGESRETAAETTDWLLRGKVDDFDVSIITVYPGTPYYNQAIWDETRQAWAYTAPGNDDKLYSLPVNFEQTADYYKGDPNGGYRSFVFTDHLSPRELVEIRNATERTVRKRLSISYPTGNTAQVFEHSMGMSGSLPGSILRDTR